jgi:uncharacterized protein YhaN
MSNLEEIDQQINTFLSELNAKNEEEATLNARIAAMRLEIARLNDSKFATKQKIREAQKNRESAARKAELDREAARIEQSLEESVKKQQILLANAPWRDVAFDWQIEGAIRLPERALLADKRGLGKTL